MTTLTQAEANRRNAQKSTGPKTREGKSRVRENALTHGLSGRGEALTPELIRAAKAYWDDLILDYVPEGRHQRLWVSQAAIAMARLDRLPIIQELHRARDQKRAARSWEEDRCSEAGRVGAQLIKRPSRTVERLAQTAQGAAWMITRWRTLQETLEAGDAWSETQCETAQALLGLDPEWRGARSRIGKETPVEQLKELTGRELDRWAALKAEQLDELDAIDRQLALAGAAFEDSPTARRFQRYEQNCYKKLNEALANLERVKRRRDDWDDGSGPINGLDWTSSEHDEPSWSNALLELIEAMEAESPEAAAEASEAAAEASEAPVAPAAGPAVEPDAGSESAAESPETPAETAPEARAEKQSQSPQVEEREPVSTSTAAVEAAPRAAEPAEPPHKGLSRRERRRARRAAERRAAAPPG